MTEKRFTIAYDEGNWWAVRDGDITLWKEEVVDLLNKLDEKWIDEFNLRETLQQELQRVEAENEQLKQENRLLKGRIQEYEEQIER